MQCNTHGTSLCSGICCLLNHGERGTGAPSTMNFNEDVEEKEKVISDGKLNFLI